MTRNHLRDKRTLQDDRAELEADPEEGSPLADDQGAPLAEDGVRRPDKAAVTHGLLGGAPIVVATDEVPPPVDPLTTPDDRPIGD